MKKLWKFMNAGLKSHSGKDRDWELMSWRHEDKLDMCNSGFHASKTPLQAFGYVQGEILAKVEVKGKSLKDKDKECWSDMRIVKAYHWTRKDSVELAVFEAEQVIDIYEKKYPNDNRPRKAIEAAKEYLRTGNVNVAASAAYVAAYAAYAASAADAAYAAYAADAAYAARKKLVAKLDKWFLAKIKTLTLYEK